MVSTNSSNVMINNVYKGIEDLLEVFAGIVYTLYLRFFLILFFIFTVHDKYLLINGYTLIDPYILNYL